MRNDAKASGFHTPSDLNGVPAGTVIEVTYWFVNTGTTVWDRSYKVAPSDRVLGFNQRFQQSDFGMRGMYLHTEVRPSERVAVTLRLRMPESGGVFAGHWQMMSPTGESFGSVRWIRVVVAAPIKLGVGMNVNPDQDVSNPIGRGALEGIRWVRYPFKAAAKRRSVGEAIEEYDHLVERAVNEEIRTLFVLNQETVWGNHAPWSEGNWGGGWGAYSDDLASATAEIAEELGTKWREWVGFQIWNEGDNAYSPHVSIYVPPEWYGKMITKISEKIRDCTPDSPIVTMGLATGVEHAIQYMKRVEETVGSLPVDALAVHPYGHVFQKEPIAGWKHGEMGWLLGRFKQAFPKYPLWLTEFGVPNSAAPLSQTHWQGIGRYMQDVFYHLERDHSDHVPVAIWYGWSDLMENGGVVQSDGTPKPALAEAFEKIRNKRFEIA